VPEVNLAMLFIAAIGSFFSTFFFTFYIIDLLVFKEVNQIYASIQKLKISDFDISRKTLLKSVNPLKKLNREISNYVSKKQEEIDELKRMEIFRREFLADVSHELKTPIFAAQGFVHTLIDGALEDPVIAERFLKKAAKSLDGLDILVRDLVVLSQVETGDIKMIFGTFDILELVKEIFEQLESKANKRNTTLLYKPKDLRACWVYGDKQRLAQVFANNGQGTRGDLKAVFKALLLDPEARQFDQGGSSNSFGKLREPMVRLIQWARTFSATSVSVEKDKEWEIYNPFIHFESELGQKPMFAPSVFNFFRPGYTPPNSGISQQGLLAPEFQILTEPAIVGYVNFMQKMVSNHEAIAKPPGYLVADYSAYVAMAIDPTLLLNKLTVCLAPHAFNASQINTMAVMLAGMPDDPAGLKKRVYTAVWLIMCVPDYLIQR
jgi:hypothetical protein